jgi:hypothetical protein
MSVVYLDARCEAYPRLGTGQLRRCDERSGAPSTLRTVSDPPEPHTAQEDGGDTEEVDAVVVVAAEPVVSALRQTRAIVPAAQAAAVAATGFVAGAAAAGLVRRRRHRQDLARSGSRRRVLAGGRGRSGRAAGELVQIVGSRSLLVDVHLLGVPGRDR